MIFQTTFDMWRRALDLYLDRFGLPPLTLADWPDGFDTVLQTMYAHEVRACYLAELLAACLPVVVGERMRTGWEKS